MSYVQQNLISGEEVVYHARLHWIVLALPVILGVILAPMALLVIVGSLMDRSDQTSTALLIGFALLLLAVTVVGLGIANRSAAEFSLTNKRVIFKQGIIRKSTFEMFLNKIESVGVDQSILGRMCGYGSVVLRGTGGSSEPFAKITQPLEFRRQIQQQISNLG